MNRIKVLNGLAGFKPSKLPEPEKKKAAGSEKAADLASGYSLINTLFTSSVETEDHGAEQKQNLGCVP